MQYFVEDEPEWECGVVGGSAISASLPAGQAAKRKAQPESDMQENQMPGARSKRPRFLGLYRELPQELIACKYVDNRKKNNDPAKGEMDNGGKVRNILGEGGWLLKNAHCFLYWKDESSASDNNSGSPPNTSPPRDVCLKLVHLAKDGEEKVICKLPHLGEAVRDDCAKTRTAANSAAVKLTLCPKLLFGSTEKAVSYNFFFVCSYIDAGGMQRAIRSPFLKLVTNSKASRRSEPETQQQPQQPLRSRLWTIGKQGLQSVSAKGVVLLVAFLFFGFNLWPSHDGARRDLIPTLKKESPVAKKRIISAGQPKLCHHFKLGSRGIVAKPLVVAAPAQAAPKSRGEDNAASGEHKLQGIVDLGERLELRDDLKTVAAFNESQPTTAELDKRLELFNNTVASYQGERKQQPIADLHRPLVELVERSS
mgnify:FL=1